ncbi:MAG: hypothetical protein A2Z91_03045 [Deltaproteobacteria bacterium GWA2_38_16]|nr:MAG: hypothetical protein A2Z91_03045 [Deltaproteobacteria bacterium GWA2_38_16]OGQ02864.1 MAG: hypothetical protein A3D19_06470 [Deltaproteobacteria bacterium RIFCSPHIGHO2_02_FULL_38_15]OGQ35117.1 MAG: hypothetical protein A3A72_03715 [Deltaproteobacteria bacterium RIFCSPLOWO2_01_FULL_38_9]HBQ21709.1 DUF1844 domain-containing protein [Deltaproteobacteria bacterium]
MSDLEHPRTIDFSTFIFSLGSAALIHLGVTANPMNNKIEKNLEEAKQNIDLLSLLQEKTKGNLTTDEEKLIHNLLHSLRMRYVEETQKS